jgi:hypothetical protein
MSPSVVATVALAFFAFVGVIAGGVAWFYRRGGQERELILAMRENSAATTNLSTRFDAFMEHYRTEYTSLDKRVDNHDMRLATNEATTLGITKEVAELRRATWQRVVPREVKPT